jgi:hypothetical protein
VFYSDLRKHLKLAAEIPRPLGELAMVPDRKPKHLLIALGIEEGKEGRRDNAPFAKFSCGCTTVRVAKSDFQARCLACGNEFLRDDDGPESGACRAKVGPKGPVIPVRVKVIAEAA